MSAETATAGVGSRLAAARVLTAVFDQGRSLKAELAATLPGLDDPRDRALVEAICFAVLRRRPAYDVALRQWLERPLPPRDAELKALLMAGFAQARRAAAARACGLVGHRGRVPRAGPAAAGRHGQRDPAARPARGVSSGVRRCGLAVLAAQATARRLGRAGRTHLRGKRADGADVAARAARADRPGRLCRTAGRAGHRRGNGCAVAGCGASARGGAGEPVARLCRRRCLGAGRLCPAGCRCAGAGAIGTRARCLRGARRQGRASAGTSSWSAAHRAGCGCAPAGAGAADLAAHRAGRAGDLAHR